MRFTCASTAWVLSSLGLLAAAPIFGQGTKPAAQNTEPGIHRLQIYNGPLRTVHYFSASGSPGEQANFREAERAENQVDLANQLLDLRNQYVRR